MTRTQLACYALIASACITGALLISQLPGINQEARAELLLNKDTLTMMTAQVRQGEDALFVIDSVNEKLLIYTTDIGQKKLEMVVPPVDLARMFGGAAPAR